MIEEPLWARHEQIEQIPEPPSIAALETMSDQQFALLIRDNLIPRAPDADLRRRWERLWQALAGDSGLRDRTFEVLDHYLDRVEAAIASAELGADLQRRRAEKFRVNCEAAWNRLGRDQRPLEWAGRRGRRFNPAAALVIEQLVNAVADHRHALRQPAADRATADDRLWQVLSDIGLDPRDFGQ